MKVPKIIKIKSNVFKFVKAYPSFCLYKETKCGYCTCFSYFDILHETY